MDEKLLYELCFQLAQDLMWDYETAPIERLPEDIKELSEMSSELMRIAKGCYYQVKDLSNGQEILFGAIKYLTTRAIPPLRGNYEWFGYSLQILLEICNPETTSGMEEMPFLLSIQKGITKSMEWSIKPEESDD